MAKSSTPTAIIKTVEKNKKSKYPSGLTRLERQFYP
jgi:hypothetical protein